MMQNNNKYKYLAQNAMLFTISSFGSKLMVFLLVPLYTSILSTSDYGIADIISTTATLCVYVLTINIAEPVMRYSIEEADRADRVLEYGFNILAKGTIIMIAGVFCVWKFNLVKWSGYCYVFLILMFVFHALEQILLNYLRAVDKIQVMVTASLLSTAACLILNIIALVFFGWGVAGYLAAMVMGPVIASTFALFHIFPLKHSEISSEEKKNLYKRMRSYGIPAAVNSVGWWIANGIDKYFLIWMKGASINGVYSVSYKIPAILSTLNNIFSQAWGLSAIKEYERDSRTDQDGFFSKMYGLYSAAMMVSSSILIFANVLIAKILFASDFFEAWRYSSLLVVATALWGLAAFLGGIFSAALHINELAISMLVSTAVNMILNMVLIPKYSALGAAVATLISYYIIWVVRYIFSRKYLQFKVRLVRDHIALIVLIIQIIMEHQEGHLYQGQAVIVIIVGLLYKQELTGCFKKGKAVIQSRLNRGNL